MDLPEALKRFIPSFDTLFLNVKGADDHDFKRDEYTFGWLLEMIRQEHADKAVFETALKDAVEELSKLTAEDSHELVRALYYLYLLIFHRRSPDEHETLKEIVAQSIKEKRRRKEFEEMEQTIAEYLLKEGEQRGEKRGEQRGEKRGEIRAKRGDVLTVLQARFDSVPDPVLKKVRSMRSLSRLDDLLRKAAVAKNVDEIEID